MVTEIYAQEDRPAAGARDATAHGHVDLTGPLSRAVFLDRYVTPNKPVLMRGAAEGWPATRDWGFAAVASRLPQAPVTLEYVEKGLFDPNRNLGRPRIAHIETTLSKALDRITTPAPGGAYYLRETELVGDLAPLLDDLGTLGLRPPGARRFTPRVWIGGAGAASPLHYDGGDSNLLVHLRGTKEFHLYPPEDTPWLYPNVEGHLPHLSKVNSLAPDLELYPDYTKARRSSLLLQPGDVLFVPAFWWHATRSPEPSISVNFWWQETRLSRLARRMLPRLLL